MVGGGVVVVVAAAAAAPTTSRAGRRACLYLADDAQAGLAGGEDGEDLDVAVPVLHLLRAGRITMTTATPLCIMIMKINKNIVNTICKTNNNVAAPSRIGPGRTHRSGRPCGPDRALCSPKIEGFKNVEVKKIIILGLLSALSPIKCGGNDRDPAAATCRQGGGPPTLTPTMIVYTLYFDII